MEDFVIEMLHITKEFPGIKANDDVTLQLRRSGETREVKVKLEQAPANWFRRGAGGRQDIYAVRDAL